MTKELSAAWIRLENAWAEMREVAGTEPETIHETIPPWKMPPLNEWSIVGMNHYHQEGEKRLYVAMTRISDGKCIQVEGRDDKYLWNKIWHKATALPTHSESEEST